MTNEEQKLREIAYKHAEPKVIWNDGNVSICPDEEKIESLLSDLTALISEGYVSKEEYNRVVGLLQSQNPFPNRPNPRDVNPYDSKAIKRSRRR